ncbi:hypothetical protein M426DRAFT_15262 [Hypoxylon sp. CI-4A]|nr:hypothetical protein M426DRAFT_15262 [Hypoxylon sp. CI-4A]
MAEEKEPEFPDDPSDLVDQMNGKSQEYRKTVALKLMSEVLTANELADWIEECGKEYKKALYSNERVYIESTDPRLLRQAAFKHHEAIVAAYHQWTWSRAHGEYRKNNKRKQDNQKSPSAPAATANAASSSKQNAPAKSNTAVKPPNAGSSTAVHPATPKPSSAALLKRELAEEEPTLEVATAQYIRGVAKRGRGGTPRPSNDRRQ